MTRPPDGADRGGPSWSEDMFDRWLEALGITDPDTEPLAVGAPVDPADGVGAGAGSDADDGPARADATGASDPWADVDLEPVDLSGDQRAYLLWHDDQPPIARLRGLETDPTDD